MNYSINNFSGGQADSDKLGVKGSFAEGIGLDIHSEPGLLKCNQKLKKESGTTVADFARFAVACSDGSSYWFGDTGKIYKRTSAGVWTLAHTATGAILGATEFDDYLYYATATTLGRYGPISATPTWVDSWQILTSATWHPMTVQGLYLLIGNNRKIATVDDSGTFTAQGTPDVTLNELPHNYEIRTLINFGIDVLVGTTADKYTSARIFRWDTVSPAYISDDDIPENGINAFIPMDNYVFAQAGKSGNIYQYTGEVLVLRKRIKGTYENATMNILPGSYTNFRGLSLFGVSNDSGDPCNEGVYSIGRYDNNYPLALNLEYVISQNKTSSISVGAMLVIGNNLLVAWKDSTTFGCDAIDWANKYSATYKTLLLDGNERHSNKDFKNYVISYKTKPTGTMLGLKTSINGGTATSVTLIDDTVDNKERGEITNTGGFIQLEVDFTASGNKSPEVEEVFVDFSIKKTL